MEAFKVRQPEVTSVEQLPQVPEVVAAQRVNYVEQIANDGFIAGAGGCALTEQRQIIRYEGKELDELQTDTLATFQRLNPWKKRSEVPPEQPQPYAGLEAKNPRLAYSIIDEQARAHGNVALEVGLPRHRQVIDRASIIWWGARSEDLDLLMDFAIYEPRVLLGLKNRLDGNFRLTLDVIEQINESRRRIGEKLGMPQLLKRGVKKEAGYSS
jgi:hypothetical protein